MNKRVPDSSLNSATIFSGRQTGALQKALLLPIVTKSN